MSVISCQWWGWPAAMGREPQGGSANERGFDPVESVLGIAVGAEVDDEFDATCSAEFEADGADELAPADVLLGVPGLPVHADPHVHVGERAAGVVQAQRGDELPVSTTEFERRLLHDRRSQLRFRGGDADLPGDRRRRQCSGGVWREFVQRLSVGGYARR